MKPPRYNFVVFSDDWGRHPSSCQHLFRRIARNHRVLWVNTLGLRAARADAFTAFRGLEKLREWRRPLRRVPGIENLWVLSPTMLPLAGPGLLGRVNRGFTVGAIRRAMRRIGIDRPILWASVPTAADYVGRLGEAAVVYYVTDDYSLWPGGHAERIRRADRRLTEAADLILPCSQSLAETHRTAHARTVLLPHAVDCEHFARGDLREPADLSGIGRPRACFFGLIYEKIDLPTLADLARERSDLQIVLIGPVATGTEAVSAVPNVHVLGPRPYERLPAYLQAMDVLLVPYVLDEETANKGPLKIRECLAAGKPTVARAIPDLQALDDVIVLYDSPAELPRAVDRALRDADSDWTRRMRERVQGHTWAARVAQIEAELEKGTGYFSAPPLPVVTAREAPPWDAFLAAHPEASIYHHPGWGRVMQRAYGNRPVYLTARRAGEVVGTLTLIGKQSGLFGSYLCSLPYFDAAGILAHDDEAARMLRRAARRLLRTSPAEWVELRQAARIDPHLPCRTDKVTFLLPLGEDPDKLWDSLKAKVRNQVRKARRAGLTAEHGGPELLSDFYALYARTMRDLGSPCHSRRFFRLILDEFPVGEAVRIFVVRRAGRPLAASFTLADRHALRVPWAGSDWRQRGLNANMLLYWSMLADACRRRLPAFDFGRSTRGSGTFRFKKQWGPEERALCWQYLLPAGAAVPELRHDSPRYRLGVACWRRLPVPVASRLGPRIIAKLS